MTVSDEKGGIARDTVTINVNKVTSVPDSIPNFSTAKKGLERKDVSPNTVNGKSNRQQYQNDPKNGNSDVSTPSKDGTSRSLY